MFPLEAFQQTLEKVSSTFWELDIRFHLTGGVTSIAYGEPRMTQDVDIVIDNSAAAASLNEMLESFVAQSFLFEEAVVRNAVADERLFQLLDMRESLKVDIHPRDLIEGELSRSELREVFPGVTLPVASLVDAAVSKLVWVSKGSHKNRRDIRQIVKRSSVEQLRQIEALANKVS